ncbi:MAG TPA: cupredoxin domain-containing protein [Bdellovibrionota bacterium]|nr:cupredoxin domain-containing protein [Bdellovibrionota bacterium]
MDRINLSLFILAATLAWPLASAAGTVLVNPPAEDTSASDGFPESRFGEPPARVELGLGPSYVRHAVSELDPIRDEAGEKPVRAGGRSPAGLAYSENPRAARQRIERESVEVAQADPKPVRFSSSEEVPRPGPNPIVRSGVQEVAVIASDLGYFPRTLFVVRDMPVRLYVTGASKSTLCIMMDSFQVRKQVRSQKIEEITFTPGLPGKYRFYCPVNGMEGTLVVKEYSTGFAEAEQSPPPAAAERAPAAETAPIAYESEHRFFNAPSPSH